MSAIEQLLTIKQVAEYLGVPVTTIYGWNSRSEGPRRYKLGRHVRYRRSDVDEWLSRRPSGHSQPRKPRRATAPILVVRKGSSWLAKCRLCRPRSVIVSAITHQAAITAGLAHLEYIHAESARIYLKEVLP